MRKKLGTHTSKNLQVLTANDFIMDRLGHVVLHANRLRDKILAGGELLGEDDDAAAIAWGAMFLCCATAALDSEQRLRNNKAAHELVFPFDQHQPFHSRVQVRNYGLDPRPPHRPKIRRHTPQRTKRPACDLRSRRTGMDCPLD